jgi:hypothetical protein
MYPAVATASRVPGRGNRISTVKAGSRMAQGNRVIWFASVQAFEPATPGRLEQRNRSPQYRDTKHDDRTWSANGAAAKFGLKLRVFVSLWWSIAVPKTNHGLSRPIGIGPQSLSWPVPRVHPIALSIGPVVRQTPSFAVGQNASLNPANACDIFTRWTGCMARCADGLAPQASHFSFCLRSCNISG